MHTSIEMEDVLKYVKQIAGEYTITIIQLETERNALKRRVAELERQLRDAMQDKEEGYLG